MNYELAKELKEAGFPQIVDKGKTLYGTPNEVVTPEYEWGNECYAPTLSELIEACGSQFIQLRQYAPNEWNAMAGTWIDGHPVHFCDVTASTPEEAVARLWLALNQKPQ